MIIVNKKRIFFVIIMLTITVFSYGVVSNNKNKETIPTISLPVSNKTIILDAGHGKPDEGAESSKRNN